MERPSWLALFAPLPDDAVPERKPVASAQQIADGTDGPIAGWENVSLNLSVPSVGLRHILIVLDASGRTIAASDHVMVTYEETRDGVEFSVSDHENIGGRFEEDGSFRGTRWKTHMEGPADSEEPGAPTSTPSPPTEEDIAALQRIVDDVMRRDANLRSQ